MVFVSVDSKELSVSVSHLFSTLTRGSISVDSKRFTLHQDGAESAVSRAFGSKDSLSMAQGGMAKKRKATGVGVNLPRSTILPTKNIKTKRGFGQGADCADKWGHRAIPTRILVRADSR